MRSIRLLAALCVPGLAALAVSDEVAMVAIPGVTFDMGTDAADLSRLQRSFGITHADLFAAEMPRHKVTLDAFRLDEHEVTNRAFKAFVERQPAWRRDRIDRRFHNGRYLAHWRDVDYPIGQADHPVVNVSWFAAVAFCGSLAKRLPTEAEWEWAASGGSAGRMFPWGDEPPDPARANYAASGLNGPVKVRSYPPNGYGLFDMAGNVWEYVADEWAPYSPAPQVNSRPGGNPYAGDAFRRVSTRRVIRGGSWGGAPVNLRVKYRDSHPPEGAGTHVGFRCAQDFVDLEEAPRSHWPCIYSKRKAVMGSMWVAR